ncbi:hypothetical protein QE152_g4820 [Popillia japonica]|uniref:Uncharacterized protein n=1 Tax=Popillia japonica TaxID=7064 RepID=A0AAW1MT04_POPJA
MSQRLRTMYLKVSENNDITIGDLSKVIDRLSSSECDNVNTVLTKHGTRWSRHKQSIKRRPTRNNLGKPLRLTVVIIQETNRRAVALRGDAWQNIRRIKMKAFRISGLLITAEYLKAGQEHILQLRSHSNAPLQHIIFAATISRNIIKELRKFIRFDNLNTGLDGRQKCK